MTVAERRRYREESLTRKLAAATHAAAIEHVTSRCQQAMLMTGSHPEQARDLHRQCKGEEAPNGGCLCQCHDDDGRSGVLAGVINPGPLDSAFEERQA